MKFQAKIEGTLLDVVLDSLGYSSKTKARNVIKTGQILVNGKCVKIPSTEINSGSLIELVQAQKGRIREERELRHKILFEDEHILAVEKRTGLIAKSANRKFKTLFTDVFLYFGSKNVETCLMVNSVDKKESGVVVFAKSLAVFKELQENWKKFRKRYYIVIPGGMLDKEGELEDTFHENEIGLLLPGKGKKTKEVHLKYRVMKTNGQHSVIRVEEVSQNKNQIRAMFSLMKNPIVGDKKYRSEETFEKGMASHLFSVELAYADREAEVKTPVPKSFLRLAR